MKIARRFLRVDHSTGLPKKSWPGTAFQASSTVILPSLCQLNGGSNDAGDGGNKLGARCTSSTRGLYNSTNMADSRSTAHSTRKGSIHSSRLGTRLQFRLRLERQNWTSY
jgi:hypothetical protein